MIETGCYVLVTHEGDLYACTDTCAADVFGVVAGSKAGVVSMYWSRKDRDVFCASCAYPIGWRRRSARLLHEAMTEIGWAFYDAMGEAECCDL